MIENEGDTSGGSEETTDSENETSEEEVIEEGEGESSDDAEGDSEEEGEEGSKKSTKGKEKADEPPKVFKLKIDGEEVEVTEEQIVRMAQMQGSSHKKFQDASKMRKDSELIVEAAKKDPIKFLLHPTIGHSKSDVRAILETHLGEEIMYEQLPDDQKIAVDNAKKVKELEETEKSRKDKEEQMQQQNAVVHYQQQYEKDFIGALETVKIPKTPETVSRMANYMNKAINKGFELTSAQAAQLVKEDYSNEFNNLFSSMEPNNLAELIGDINLKKLRKRDKEMLIKNNKYSSNDDSIKTPPKVKKLFNGPNEFASYLDNLESG